MTRADPTLEPWAVEPSQFPTAGGAAEQLAFLVRFAVLAPSGHNTQPWCFRVEQDTLEVRADRARGLPVVDPEDRELTISCGAALGTLEHAGRGLGVGLSVAVLPDGTDDDLVARVRITGSRSAGDADRARLAAITRRATNRQVFAPTPVPPELVPAMHERVSEAGCWLTIVVDEAAKATLADLVSAGDRVQMEDRRFRRELAAWLRPNTSSLPDGMRGYGFGFSDLMSRVGPFVVRTFDLGKGQAAKDRDLATGAPLLAVIGTLGDTAADWVATGRALAGVLLEARAAAVWASYLNQPIEVTALRPQVANAIGHDGEHPQLLLRMGFGPDPKPEPRRAAVDVLLASVRP